MYVIDNKELARSGLRGLQHTTLAGSDNGLKELSVWRQVIDAGAATPPHRHDCEEVVMIESGSGELHIGGSVYPFGADMTLVIPPSRDHQILNTGNVPMKLVGIFSVSPVTVLLPDGQPLPLPWKS